jgi:glycosyltransferase involved in cell wall biosynthesis
MAPRVLIVVGADAARTSAAGPRRDYAVLAERLQATLLDVRRLRHSIAARVLRRVAGIGMAQAWLAFTQRGNADVIVTDGEGSGIPLAVLLRLGRSRVGHVTIGHRLTSRKKQFFLRILSSHKRMDRIVVHSRYQHDFARTALHVPTRRLALLPYQVDTDFWSPTGAAEERLVVSAGLEHRDYPTLMRAVHGLDARVVIGAASNWSRHDFAASAPPANVEIGAFDYTALRDLYARAAVVVVPLKDVDNQAGVTTILEAMAMGKPVIVSQSFGQTDVVEDRRDGRRGLPRERPVSLARILAAGRGLDVPPNGFYVPPGDPGALRRAIEYLLANADERQRLGQSGRYLAQQLFTVDEFAARIADLVAAVAPGDAERARQRLQFG